MVPTVFFISLVLASNWVGMLYSKKGLRQSFQQKRGALNFSIRAPCMACDTGICPYVGMYSLMNRDCDSVCTFFSMVGR